VGNIGLLFVGIVLLVNGLNALGVVPAKSTAVLNLFVGTMQVVLPTIVLIQNSSDPAVINATWPTYLFGITYLYYGINILFSVEPEGFGWFSAFVAAIAGYHAVLALSTDPIFAVIWLTWAIMWTLFFLILGLGKTELTRFAGWFLIIFGIPTCTISALFLFQDVWSVRPSDGFIALGLLAAGSVLALSLARSPIATSRATESDRTEETEPVSV